MLRVLHLHICKYGDRKQLTRGRRNSNSVADSTPSRLRGAPAFRNIPRPICSANHSFRAKAIGNDLGAAAQGLPLYPRPSSATRSATRSCFHYHHRWCEKTLVNPEHVSDCALCHGDPFWPGPGVSWCCCCPALGCHLSYVYWRSPPGCQKRRHETSYFRLARNAAVRPPCIGTQQGRPRAPTENGQRQRQWPDTGPVRKQCGQCGQCGLFRCQEKTARKRKGARDCGRSTGGSAIGGPGHRETWQNLRAFPGHGAASERHPPPPPACNRVLT